MVISGNDSIEFVVNESAFLCLKQRQKRVESLYNVTVTSDSLEGELRWVKVSGDEKLRMKAKEYITSMGKPECEKIIDIEQLCCGQLNEASLDKFLFILEQRCSANIVLIDKVSIRVSGSAVSVAKVESYLNNLLSNNQNIELELPPKRARLESISSVDSKDSALSLSDDFSAFDHQVEDLLVSLGEEEKYGRLISSDSGLKENIDPMLHETSEDFAAKLGYSKDLYAQAVKKVGREADRNELLNELVKLKNSRKELNEEPQKERPDRRRSSCSFLTSSKQLRPIIIDGSNVAMSHGKQKIFSCRGIQIAVEWFIPRGHKSIYVVIPNWRKESPSERNVISNQEVLKILEGAVEMIYTPSKILKQKRIACYDDRYILNIACDKDGVVVSNDNFRDLYLENNKPEWKKIIEERVLMYSFVDDMFMPPDDPHGRNGPHIDELLSFGSTSKTRVCHYGRQCTYGRNCKYAHPERESEGILRDTPSNAPRPYSEPVPLADAMCEDFKRLSLPDLNRNQPPPLIARSRHTSSPQLPPALPSRRPTQQHRAPPLPPRGNGMHCGMRTTNESPYAPLPVHVEQAQMMYLARQQQPRLPPRRNQNYDTLPFTHQMIQIPPHAQNHQYYNLPPPGAYIPNGNLNRRGRGGPYDNLPPDGQMPVYPPRNHAIYQTQQNYYRSRAPPAEDSSDEDMPMVPEDKQGELNSQLVESEHLRGISKRIQCRENGSESRMQAMVNVA